MKRIALLPVLVGVLCTTCVVFAQATPARKSAPASGPQVRLQDRPLDPYGSPRPARDAINVPLRTSIYFELSLLNHALGDCLPADSVAVSLQPGDDPPIELIQPGRRFAAGASGWVQAKQVQSQSLDKPADNLIVYIEPGTPLKPATKYTVRIRARSQDGLELPEKSRTWSFTTEQAAAVHPVRFNLDLDEEPVHWHGQFFSGVCDVSFCTGADVYGPTFEMMDQARKEHPRAWSLDRNMWLTSDGKPEWATFFDPRWPNLVRERETRRIKAIETGEKGVLLHVEDFFGHQQYGIADHRPVSEDYHAGDEILVADGTHDARARVLAADDKAGTVLLDALPAPTGSWRIDYREPLPQKEDSDAPGLFAVGGCYLRKFHPHGTACYYWGRLDKQWDLTVQRYDRRVIVNFVEAPTDLSLDGRGATTVKDYVQWHEVVRTIAGHVIDRYREKSLSFYWSLFNEPDLIRVLWRSDWTELQKFYDYSADAILRAFEDRGYDSGRVVIGGLELGAIFSANLKLNEFLAHCSPSAGATAQGALPLNAAFADPRLDGRRSKRVETLCRAHAGKGSPCDFISVHTYNSAQVAAAKLIRAKEMALQMDPNYYRDLRIHSHESCPSWAPPPDPAASDSYLGNGYYPSWCADLMARQLRKAAEDGRYACGETILTIWPPVSNLVGANTFTRILSIDEDDDGRGDRKVTIACPIFHAVTLLTDMGERYWVLPSQQIGGHVVSGFASRDNKGVVRLAIYSHHGQDTQSRSEASFDVTVKLDSTGRVGPVTVQEYRFDRENNSYFRQAKALARTSAGPTAGESLRRQEAEELVKLSQLRSLPASTLPAPADGRLMLTTHLAGNGLNILVIR